MLGSDVVKIFEYLFTIIDSCEVFGAVEINVKLPEVDSEVDEEGDTIEMTLG